MGRAKQQSFFKPDWRHQHAHGGTLRCKRAGRGPRPLAVRSPLHIVFKLDRAKLRRGSLRSPREFSLVEEIISRYARRFYIKIEQKSVQSNHIHMLVRTSRRCQLHHFLRVVAGQIAQGFEKRDWLKVTDTPRNDTSPEGTTEKLWIYRPFSRIVQGYRAYTTVIRYIQLNEAEATGKVKYQKDRLRGLSNSEWDALGSA